jgi:hypothetical protein
MMAAIHLVLPGPFRLEPIANSQSHACIVVKHKIKARQLTDMPLQSTWGVDPSRAVDP